MRVHLRPFLRLCLFGAALAVINKDDEELATDSNSHIKMSNASVPREKRYHKKQSQMAAYERAKGSSSLGGSGKGFEHVLAGKKNSKAAEKDKKKSAGKDKKKDAAEKRAVDRIFKACGRDILETMEGYKTYTKILEDVKATGPNQDVAKAVSESDAARLIIGENQKEAKEQIKLLLGIFEWNEEVVTHVIKKYPVFIGRANEEELFDLWRGLTGVDKNNPQPVHITNPDQLKDLVHSLQDELQNGIKPTEQDKAAYDIQPLQGLYDLETMEFNGNHYYGGRGSAIRALHMMWIRQSYVGQFTSFKDWLYPPANPKSKSKNTDTKPNQIMTQAEAKKNEHEGTFRPEDPHKTNTASEIRKSKEQLLKILPSQKLLYLKQEIRGGALSDQQQFYEMTVNGKNGEYSVPAFGGKFVATGENKLKVPEANRVHQYVYADDKDPTVLANPTKWNAIKKWGDSHSPIKREGRTFQKHPYPMVETDALYEYIFALRRQHLLVAPKMTFVMHHSSLFAGQPVAAAGTLDFLAVKGKPKLVRITLESGHYTPLIDRLANIVKWFWGNGFTDHDFWCGSHGVICHGMVEMHPNGDGIYRDFNCRSIFGFVMDGKKCDGSKSEDPDAADPQIQQQVH